MDTPPLLAITHVKTDNGVLTEIGAMLFGRLVWRVPTRTVVTLYRAGVRFFITVDGKSVEVVVEVNPLTREPELRTVADRPFSRQLFKLPRLHEEPANA